MTVWAAVAAVAILGAEPARDPWRWPFAADSVWNTPVGSGAVYVPAGLKPAKNIGIDEELLFRTPPGAPERPVFGPKSWETRAGGTQRLGSLKIADGVVVPDARKGWTPNYCAAFLLPDGRTVRNVGPLCRPEKGGPVFGYVFPDTDLYGPGVGGSHGGSQMSALGGSLRAGELTGSGPVRHAIKVVIHCEPYAYYGPDRKGFRWPATGADSYADKGYRGANKAVVMGSLLALPPAVTADELGLKTPVGRKLFDALRDYGAYVVDDAAWDCHYLCGEKGVVEELDAAGLKLDGRDCPLRDDVNALFARLAVIDNNAPGSVGGGGDRRAPPAPPLPEPPPARPAKAANAWTAAEGFYPDYPHAWRQVVAGQLERAKKGGGPLVFLGDSLTQGWDQGVWKEKYEPRGAVNLGVGGDGTPQVLWRVDKGVLDGLSPKVVVLMIGVNNLWPGFSAADSAKGVAAVVKAVRAKQPKAKVLLLGVLPLFGKGDGARKHVAGVNAALAKLDDGAAVRFLDLGPKFLAADGELKAGMYQPDRLHLTPAAYRAWADAMEPLLAGMLEP